MDSKKILCIVFALAAALPPLHAQIPAGYVIADSLIFTRRSAVDTVLVGRDILEVMPSCVSVCQSDSLRVLLSERIEANDAALFGGYRIRIFSDNSQSARGASSELLYRFKTHHPEMPAYRTFDNPNFKVTVGDFRTKSEALCALKTIQTEFPTAFVVRESFKFPAFSTDDEFVIDTLKVLRRL